MSLKGKRVVVTGAGSWIGKEISIQLASKGAEVLLLGRTKQNIALTAKEINSKGYKAQYFQVDLSDSEQISVFAKELKEEVNILVHAAAIYPRKVIHDIKKKEWDEVIATNLTSAYQLVHELLPKMPKYSHSRIIFISSVAGSVIGPKTFSAYGASKAGVDGLMKSLASELGGYGFTVNSILPGNICNVERFSVSEEQKKSMLSAIPVARFGTPKDIAAAVCFLAEEESGFINGHQLVIDGGETITN